MYLLPNSSPVNNRKWNIGRMRGLAAMGCNCSARGIGTPPQKRMGQLGDGAGVPSGSRLSYTVTFTPSTLSSVGFSAGTDTIAKVTANLQQQWQIAVTNATQTSSIFRIGSTFTYSMQVQVGQDFGAVADVKSILDGAFYNAAGAQVTASSISLTSTGQGSAAPPPPAIGTQAGQDAASQSQLSDLQTLYQNAVGVGDSTTANNIAKQIVALGYKDPRGYMGFLSDNWPWIAAAGVGLLVVKEL